MGAVQRSQTHHRHVPARLAEHSTKLGTGLSRHGLEGRAFDHIMTEAANRREGTVHAANVFTWEGTPSAGRPRLLYTIYVDSETSAAATGDDSFPLEPTILDPRTMTRIPVADGPAYVEALPFHFRNAPYLWAEAAVIPRPDAPP